LETQATPAATAALRLRSRRRILLLGCAVVGLAGLAAWLWEELTPGPTVYVVGDSITSLSGSAISGTLTDAGYRPTIRATPGVKIGQAQTAVTTLAQQQPWAWIVELGTDDAGARDAVWPQPFLAEWAAISPATCVVYVTVSQRAGPVALQIDSSIDQLAASHPNVHVIDWGSIEYKNPAWVAADGIHPTPEGQAVLAGLETQALQHAC
jgi:hypothetical protein